jgi:hypothetical protein
MGAPGALSSNLRGTKSLRLTPVYCTLTLHPPLTLGVKIWPRLLLRPLPPPQASKRP